MNIGIDLGFTIKGVRAENNRDKIAPNAFLTINRMIKAGHNIFIISKVNSEQKKRVDEWLDNIHFFNETGVPRENVYFCFERKDKSFFVTGLDIDVMIDDRAEVMAHLDSWVSKFLLSPEESELKLFEKQLGDTIIVKDWYEIETHFFLHEKIMSTFFNNLRKD